MQKPARRTKVENNNKRQLAKMLFISTGITGAEIAARIGVAEKTISQWRKADNWDEERTLRNVSPIQLIKRLNEEIELLLNQTDEQGNKIPLGPKAIDSVKKLTKSIKDLRHSIDPQTTMEVLHGFMNWLAGADINLAQQLTNYAMAYVQVKLKENKDK